LRKEFIYSNAIAPIVVEILLIACFEASKRLERIAGLAPKKMNISIYQKP
jgi:hypothetical protein